MIYNIIIIIINHNINGTSLSTKWQKNVL